MNGPCYPLPQYSAQALRATLTGWADHLELLVVEGRLPWWTDAPATLAAGLCAGFRVSTNPARLRGRPFSFLLFPSAVAAFLAHAVPLPGGRHWRGSEDELSFGLLPLAQAGLARFDFSTSDPSNSGSYGICPKALVLPDNRCMPLYAVDGKILIWSTRKLHAYGHEPFGDESSEDDPRAMPGGHRAEQVH